MPLTEQQKTYWRNMRKFEDTQIDREFAAAPAAGFQDWRAWASDIDLVLRFLEEVTEADSPCGACGAVPAEGRTLWPVNILQRGYGGRDEQSNLLALCADCARSHCRERVRKWREWVRACAAGGHGLADTATRDSLTSVAERATRARLMSHV